MDLIKRYQSLRQSGDKRKGADTFHKWNKKFLVACWIWGEREGKG